LRNLYEKDFDKLLSKVEQTADGRKAQLDKDAAAAARGVLDQAELRQKTAGREESKLKNLIQMTIEDLQRETDSSKKGTLQTQITQYETDMAIQKALKEAAEKEVTRYKEANENADKLATIAQEIADAKNATDEIVQDFIDSRDELGDAIQEREDTFF
jgi:hypothetical protein